MKLSLQLGVLSAANIGLSFVFQWYVLTQFGAGIETDALFAGMTIPQLVLAVISGSLMHVLVPLLSGECESRIRHDAWGFFILIGAMFTLFAILLYITATWWVPLTVPGFSAAGQALAVKLTRIQLVGMVFAAVNGVQWAAYHAKRQFVWAEFTPFIVSLFSLLLLMWALPRFGVVAAAWIGTLRMGLQTLILVPGMGRPIWPDMKSPAIRQAWHRIKPLLLGTAYYKTDPVVDRFLLSTAGTGSLSLYYLAQQMYGAVGQVINKAIAAPLVPALSSLYKSGDKETLIRVYNAKLLQLSALCLFGLLILGVFGQALLGWLVGYGNVSASNVVELWWIMIWLAGMFVGGVVGQIASSAFYSVGDTVTPTRMSIVTFTAYIPAKILFFHFWGITGLAIATSVHSLVNLFLLIYLFKKEAAL
jgi:putative peptidoglycan lipid II flippase